MKSFLPYLALLSLSNNRFSPKRDLFPYRMPLPSACSEGDFFCQKSPDPVMPFGPVLL